MVDFQVLTTLLAVLSIPFIVVGVMVNTLVIYIVHSTQAMHSTTNFLLVNLAVSDLLTLILWPAHWEIWWQGRQLSGATGSFLCKTFTGVTILDILYVVSSFTLMTLAVERYNALVKPFHSSLRLSIEHIKPTVMIIWFGSILFCLPDFILRSVDNDLKSCVGPWTIHMDYTSRTYVICNLVFTVYLPFFVLVFCYGSIIEGLYFSNTICAETSTEHDNFNQDKKQLVVTFVAVTGGFFLCFTPLASQFMYLHVACTGNNPTAPVYGLTYQLLWFVLMATSALNPAFYAFRSSNFREGFRRIINFPCREEYNSRRSQNIPLE